MPTKGLSLMQTRHLGHSTLAITPMGLGAWAIGGEWRFGWGPQDDAQSIATIKRAIALGINWIDTAPAYGLGRSEEVVGRALADIPRADRPYVFTKCSLVWNEEREVTHSLRPESIRRECEASLRRLGVDRIDLYQIHWPRWPAMPADYDPGRLEDAWRTMADLRREGKIRYLGASNFTVEDLARVAPIAPIASLQPPYSLLRRDAETRALPYCRAHDIGVIVYSPMQSGLLTGRMTRERVAGLPDSDWRKGGTWFREPNLSRALEVVELLRDIGRHRGATPGEVAIAWTLHNPAVTGAIVGARRPEQLDELIKAATITLDNVELAEIDRLLVATGLHHA
jgi:aryl-alcohol dehydrogenase-like predicted oxidoreductase